MAEVPDWQRQNMKKGGNAGAPSPSGNKMYPNGTVSNLHSKIAQPTHGLGNLLTGQQTARGYADGGEVAADDKAAGLAASSGEKVGFFERLSMGNIDEPGSKAYNQFGAGRAQGDAAQTQRENAVMDRKASYNAPQPAASDDGFKSDIREESRMKSAPAPSEDAPVMEDQNFGTKSSEPAKPAPVKAVAPVKVAAPAKTAPAKPAPVRTAEVKLASVDDDFPPATQKSSAAPSVDPNRVESRPVKPQAVRDKEAQDSVANLPIVKGIKSIADWLSSPSKSSEPAKSQPRRGVIPAKASDVPFMGGSLDKYKKD